MLFLRTFLTVLLAEMGDKSQFLLMSLSNKYHFRTILSGFGLAVVALNVLAVGVGLFIGNFFPMQYIKLGAGIAFLTFALISVFGKQEEQGTTWKKRRGPLPLLTVFTTYFAAELGDKTQLAVMAFAADAGAEHLLPVLLGSCLGLFIADFAGLLAGAFFVSKLPARAMSYLSFLLFACFGIASLNAGFRLLPILSPFALLCTVLSAIAFAVVFLVVCCMTKKIVLRSHAVSDASNPFHKTPQ